MNYAYLCGWVCGLERLCVYVLVLRTGCRSAGFGRGVVRDYILDPSSRVHGVMSRNVGNNYQPAPCTISEETRLLFRGSLCMYVQDDTNKRELLQNPPKLKKSKKKNLLTEIEPSQLAF